MGDVVGEETRPWSDCKGADVQVAELRLSPSYCCVQAGETVWDVAQTVLC